MALLVVGVLAAVMFTLFRGLERRDRGLAVIAIVWAMLLLEVAVYPNQSTVPPGVFHPSVGELSFRLLDIAVPIAVATRISVHGLGRFGGNGLLWVVFLAWLATSGVIGVLNGNPVAVAGFEAKAILYLSAIYLTATIPAGEYVTSRHIRYLIGAAAALATLLLITDTAGVAIDLGAALPEDSDIVASAGEAVDPAGALSADAATIFVPLGIIALALAFNTPHTRQRALLMIAAAPLLASTIGGGQRAAYVEAAVALAVLVVLISVSRRALKTTPTEIALAAMIAAALVILPTIVSTATAGEAKRPPWEQEIVASISGPIEQQTTEGRLYQWRTAGRLIGERPVLGWGLGREYEYFDPGFFQFFKVDITHNIGLDLLLRSGLIGLLIFLAAIGTSALRGLRAWFEARDDLVAALALGTLAAVAGLLAKAMAESVFEKYRVAVALALLIGILISAASAYEQSRASDGREGGPRKRLRRLAAARP